jgi:hypothetical protein
MGFGFRAIARVVAPGLLLGRSEPWFPRDGGGRAGGQCGAAPRRLLGIDR